MSEVVLWIITSLLFLIGLSGTIVPGLPGIGLVYVGVLLYAFLTDFAQISVQNLVIFGFVTIFAMAVNYAGSVIGTRLGGGKKWALIGTVLGAVIGFMAGPIGIFIGAFLGAFFGAVLEGNTNDKALKVAMFSIIGVLGAGFVQFILALTMIVSFLILVFI